MEPEHIRKRWGFAGQGASAFSVFSTSAVFVTPAFAQATTVSPMLNSAPLAIALGAGGFALIALVVMRRVLREGKAARLLSAAQIADLRARVDEYEGLLAGTREVTIVWRAGGDIPKFLGHPTAVLPIGRRAESLLNFPTWLGEPHAASLARAVEALRANGQAFDLSLKALDGRLIRTSGWAMGDGAVVRFRPAFLQPEAEPLIDGKGMIADLASARAILALLSKPAFARDGNNRLIFANQHYLDLARQLGKPCTETKPAELIPADQLRTHFAALADTNKPISMQVALGSAGAFDLVEFPISGGKAGYLRSKQRPDQAVPQPSLSHITGIIDALATPIAIFAADRSLVQFNRAYRDLWNLDERFLKLGLDERAILDRLRTDNMLPAESDYQAWRARHLASYGLKTPKEHEPWHLPDGRSIKVISAPAGPEGGVIYVFEDISERLKLESQNKAMTNVQRETLNALSEGVAVFGTNGRLTLSNPRLSAFWRLPTNELGQHPHIDQIAESVARSMPADGGAIWRDLKRGIIDLNPTRSDTTGRINRADGRLFDYAITRLPDGQTMMTFVDVTESANYSRLLRERNDALVMADRLKDAFVQNVSYELRSPLTNIIGFADLLATSEVGPLNERQRSYTDYIRASSVTLGVLIDNILDLANVDAGIAHLHTEPVDIATLVEKAKAGLAATFPEVNGERQLNLAVDIDPDLPAFVADGTRIVQVLYNLLSNAARFSEPGAEIRLSVEGRAHNRILFVVDDFGPGVTEEMRTAITERGDTAMAGRQRGAGLGLAIVRTFVHMHGGTISLEPREPRGTRVIVNLPADASMASAVE
ncbi:MAG: hypothetical protein JWR75_2111 [Devosia sp.]|nr:hypothetical protein [Devosia sp.]